MALESIDAADRACGGNVPEFGLARQRLQVQTTPLARGAADTHRLVHTVLLTRLQACRWCDMLSFEADKIVKKADRAVRDVVVLRLLACCDDPRDRDGFMEKATEAYDNDLDKEVRAQLFLAYHKDCKVQGPLKSGFPQIIL